MKLYYYDNDTLIYKPVTITSSKGIVVNVCLFICTILFMSLVSYTHGKKIGSTTNKIYEGAIHILTDAVADTFSYEKLEEFVMDLNLKYPDIILAQAKLETGNFTSRIFKENNNLFGMREAVTRPTLAKGTQYDHAYYNNWRESVLDYAIYQACYLRKLSRDEYLSYLDRVYAEGADYDKTLEKIIKEST